jgi:8-oxo-dGTP pyrophosphatase MutT (NUDIX family)
VSADWPDYVCAILSLPDGRLLLERRPDGIRNAPGQLTCFGGRREAGETPEAALRRELDEELGWQPEAIEAQVELFVGTRRVAWFYAARVDVALDRLRTEPDREAVPVDAGTLDPALSSWHRHVLRAWQRGERRVDLPDPGPPSA